MVTAAGSGYSRWRDLAVTRWREDPTCDDTGSYIYLRDVASGQVWSAGYQPCGVAPDSYEVTFTEDRAEFVRRDGVIATTLQIVVSSEDDAEVRHLAITNTSSRVRDIEVTSFLETVLAPPPQGAAAHIRPSAISLSRRSFRCRKNAPCWPRGAGVPKPESPGLGSSPCGRDRGRDRRASGSMETDRSCFLGRGRGSCRGPRGHSRGASARQHGRGRSWIPFFPCVSPVCASRPARPCGSCSSHGSRGYAGGGRWDSRTSTMTSTFSPAKPEPHLDAVPSLACGTWEHSGSEKAHLFQRLAGRILYSDPSLRPRSHQLALNTKTQSGLWAYGISAETCRSS